MHLQCATLGVAILLLTTPQNAAQNIISLAAGTGTAGYTVGEVYVVASKRLSLRRSRRLRKPHFLPRCPDNIPATSSQLNNPRAVVVNSDLSWYIAGGYAVLHIRSS